MKLACSTWMMPGDTFVEKIQKAAEYGFDGVEIRLFEEEASPQKIQEIMNALEAYGIAPCSLIMPGETYRKPLLDEQTKRDKVALARKALAAAATLGCPTIVCPEYGAQIPLPLFDHPRRLAPTHYALLLEYLTEVAAIAEETDTLAMIEPINRYETRFFYSLADGQQIIDAVGSPNLYLLADFFHMNMEESDIPSAIRNAGSKILHVHLGDNNRSLPGLGATDFRAGFAALREIGYDRFMALECSTPGDPDVVFPRCIDFLKSCCSF